MGRLRKVRSESGRLLPFRQSRISDSIKEAVEACGTGDAILAEELAGVVTLFLEKRFDDDNPPLLSEVREMIYKVLVETGHVRIASTFRRLQQRGLGFDDGTELELEEESSGPEETELRLQVIPNSGGIPEPWRRDFLIRSLIEEVQLADAEAEEIAVEVERSLAIAGLTRVSTSLIREFVDVEMASRGYESALSRYRLLGVSKRDVEGWLFPENGRAEDPEEACARAVLSGYELEEVHAPTVSKAHVDGRMHILGLGHPQKVESVTFDATGPLLRPAERIEDFLLDLVTLLQALRPLARQRIVIRRFGEVVDRLPKRASVRALERFVEQLLEHFTRVDVFGRQVFPPVTLELSLDESRIGTKEQSAAEKLAMLLLDQLEQRPSLQGRLGLEFQLCAGSPFVWPKGKILDKLLSAARRHHGVGLRLEREASAGEARNGMGKNSILLDVGAVALNVPYAMALADVRHADEVTQALDGPIRLAIDAIFEKYWFFKKVGTRDLARCDDALGWR